MLIEFKLKNFRSIRDTQTLSLVASTGKELQDNICPSEFDEDLQLARSAVIYGPNAGGKSNLIRALFFMKVFVLTSAKESQLGEKIPVQSFLFDKNFREQGSEFEIEFSQEGIRYQYGFILDENQIMEEWLLAYPSGRVQQWFMRHYDKKKKKYDWKFSKYFTGKKHFWADSTRNNALFLSTAIQLNNEQLIPVFNWFQKKLVVIPTFSPLHPFLEKSIDHIKTEKGKENILEYLKIADSSIKDILLSTEPFPEEKLFNDDRISEEMKGILKKEIVGKKFTKVSFIHPDNAELRLSEESDGTKRLFAYAGYWIDALKTGKVLVIDELDSSLHPLSVRYLINQINNSSINKKNTQLVFSTHDTAQLDNSIFRRDQIWFVEKDEKDSTHLYSLLEFKPRKNEAIGKGYLMGRYGALPYIGEWRF